MRVQIRSSVSYNIRMIKLNRYIYLVNIFLVIGLISGCIPQKHKDPLTFPVKINYSKAQVLEVAGNPIKKNSSVLEFENGNFCVWLNEERNKVSQISIFNIRYMLDHYGRINYTKPIISGVKIEDCLPDVIRKLGPPTLKVLKGYKWTIDSYIVSIHFYTDPDNKEEYITSIHIEKSVL